MKELFILLTICVITIQSKFIPRPQTGSRRTGADILTANGEKVPIEIKNAEKLSPNVGILGVQVHDDQKKNDEKEKEEAKMKKPIESDEERLEKMQQGYHVPGNIVKQGSMEFDPNVYQLPQQQQQPMMGGYPMAGYGGWGGYQQPMYAGR